MLDKINEIIERNNLTEDDLMNPGLMARIALAAFGCQAQSLNYPTLGFYKAGKLVAKVQMPNPMNNPWFAVGFKYQSPRLPNLVGWYIDFENGLLMANRKETGLDKGPEYTLGFDLEISFDEVKIERQAARKIEVYA